MADNAGKNGKACLAVVGVFLLICFAMFSVGVYQIKHAPKQEPTQRELEAQQTKNTDEWKERKKEIQESWKPQADGLKEIDRINLYIPEIQKKVYNDIEGLLDCTIGCRYSDKEGVCITIGIVVEDDITEAEVMSMLRKILVLCSAPLCDVKGIDISTLPRREAFWNIFTDYTLQLIAVANENMPNERTIYIGLHKKGEPFTGEMPDNLMRKRQNLQTYRFRNKKAT